MEVVRDACESVAVIENGRLAEQGTVEEVFTDPKSQAAKDLLLLKEKGWEGKVNV